MPNSALVNKQFFKLQYSIIGQILVYIFADFVANNIGKFNDYQIFANTLILKLI